MDEMEMKKQQEIERAAKINEFISQHSTGETNGKLTVEALQELDKSFDEMKEIEVAGYTLNIYTKFRETEINKIATEIVDAMNSFAEHGTDISIIMMPYIMFLTIKHFSDLEIPDDLQSQLAVLNMLIDNGLLTKIFDELDKNQVAIVNHHLSNFVNGMRIVAQADASETEKLMAKLANEPIQNELQ